MSYNPQDYHVDAGMVVSGILLAALVFFGMGIASMDLSGTMQIGFTAMAGDTQSGSVTQCL